ncbi:hypothetical protein [Herbaspirillum huttiense]|uniref:hypothetical protein n=1 Tax=Herbaspirillum huttiense TaxID=863372 RepID=UPI002176AEF8|nr:hypothetical protein [Herbaspirillum huttiense]UWE19349.1 hypothetical protein NY669_26605 [Herbaspirillum huttiense]
MKILRMPQEAFMKAATSVSKRGFAPETLMMAKEVLVKGRAPIEVAREHNIAPSQLNAAVAKIRKAYQENPENASGVVRVELDLPSELALELQNFAESYQAKAGDPEASASLQRIITDLKFASRKLQLPS